MENSKLKFYKTDNWNRVMLDDKIIIDDYEIDIEELFSHLHTNYDVSVKWIDRDEWDEHFE